MVQLGQLRGLRELTLRFPSPTDENSRLCISPLSRLTNLQQLVVQGVLPTTPQAAAAAAGGEGGAVGEAAAAAAGGIAGGDFSLTFPKSLTSLMLEGHGRDGNDIAELLLCQWMVNVPAGNNIKELHVLNYHAEDEDLLRELDLSRLKQLRHFRFLIAPYTSLALCDVMSGPHGLVSLFNLEVIEVGTYGWQLPIMPHAFMCPGVRSVLDPLVKLKKLSCIGLHELHARERREPVLLEELSCYIGDRAQAWPQ